MIDLPAFATTLIGSWPRSRELLKAKRRYEQGQLSEEDFYAQAEEETKRVIELQDDLGLDVITSGELTRDNYSSFVATHLDGAELLSMNDMVDYMPDKQAFEDILSVLDVPSISIKNAICTGQLGYHPLALHELKWLKKYTDKPVKITLPGPYLMTRSMWLKELSGKAYDSKEDLGQAVLKILAEEIKNLQDLGVDIIQFDEPVLTEVIFSEGKTRSFMCGALSEKKDFKEEIAFATDLIAQAMSQIDRTKSLASLHVCRGNWSKDESILLEGPYTALVPLFRSVKADLLTLEFSTPRAGELSALLRDDIIRENCRLGLGVENPRLDEAESVQSIVDRAEEALEYLPKERLLLNPDCGFATFANRPVNDDAHIPGKIKALVEAAHTLRDRHGEA